MSEIVDERYAQSALTGQIIGCAMRVHAALGNGFPEIIYQRALAVEMESEGMSFDEEFAQPVYYRNVCIGSRRVDFLVGGEVLVELKATHELTDLHLAQTINYLKAFKLEVGLLINFGEKSLRYRRLVKSQKQK
ncbi:GxxExxY protein [Hymenobacter gummosus]|uniref:GxxExxY protein n=1 Tax=Hymenobacter gummosus TaxID=1776032 RepID=A0A431U7G3_9BACT|nr:GxxExxY protein [Hymenobacter gummosus]RTQ52390.1 GxxExxY protein [Hymenobacter gummosus]